ncbi:hypothetical protein BDQ17DRAFT_1422801 [Cyathus striatus]|nr:hypothetical protein BDQ17DRAFT_1422801 [Cyathus striatus]
MPETILSTLLEHTQVFHYMNVASIVLLYYDYLLTFNLEVSLIWPSNWGAMKILFLLARYTPFIDSLIVFYHHFAPNISQESCLKAYEANGWMYIAGACFAEIILTLRTWAVWRKDPVVKFGLPAFFIAVWVASCVIVAKFLRTLEFAHAPYPGFRGCLVIGGSSILCILWILLMVFNTGTLILMGLRASRTRRLVVTSELLQTVYRDGITYYIYLFVLSLVNVILVLKLPLDYVNLLSTLERVMQSILGCRVILHIRERGIRSLGDETFL